MLTSLFLQSQAESQATIETVAVSEYRLPRAEVRKLEVEAPQKDASSESIGVEVSAESVLVIDADTKKVLYEKNPNEVRSIASITKLMTALVFLDNNPGWDSVITISESDYREGGIIYLIAGEEVSATHVFYTALVASSNEAAVALSRSTGLNNDEFVAEMNKKAKSLGMLGTKFSDVTGLNNENKSTATDIVILSKNALSNIHISKATGTRQYPIDILNKGIVRNIKTTNRVLHQRFGIDNQVYTILSGKTGYLESAGYCFTSKIKDNNGMEIFAVVLGSTTINSRFSDTKSLAYWVFNNYKW
jgi:D-alanyl-D-alanine endopeptidase (penicillin-binding protein 7)